MNSSSASSEIASTWTTHVRSFQRELPQLAVLTALWWLAIGIVNPSGEHPLNDDWAYAPPVRSLVEEGRISFTNWQSMPLLSHVLWGALFCLPFGFSFFALRLSTLVAGWLGVLALYALMRQLGASRSVATLGAATLAANPIYLGLAGTFMTDVPFVAALVAATAAWIRGVTRDAWSWRVVALALAVWATLGRQLGIALPLAWIIVEAFRAPRSWLLRALLPGLLVIGSLSIAKWSIEQTVGLPALYLLKEQELGVAVAGLLRLRGLRQPLERSLVALAYLGLFVTPMLVLTWRRIENSRARLALPLAGGLLALGLGLAGHTMPASLGGNVLVDFGLGPRTLPGEVNPGPPSLWIPVTAVSGSGALMLLAALGYGAHRAGIVARVPASKLPARIWAGLRGGFSGSGVAAWQWLLLVLVPLLAFAPTAVTYSPFFDRYLLALLPFALVLLWAATDRLQPSKRELTAAWVLCVASLAFSVAAAHDYLAWQRTRWAAVTGLAAQGIERANVRGGFEVDNLTNREPTLVNRESAPWVISSNGLARYEVVNRVAVDAWLPYSLDAVYVLRRSASHEPSRQSVLPSPAQ